MNPQRWKRRGASRANIFPGRRNFGLFAFLRTRGKSPWLLSGFLSRRCRGLRYCVEWVPEPEVSSPPLGVSGCNTVHSIWLRIKYIALEETLRVLDFAYWLNCYLIPVDYWTLCLHFLTCMIILWLKFFHRQKEGWGPDRVVGRSIGFCSISVSLILSLEVDFQQQASLELLSVGGSDLIFMI